MAIRAPAALDPEPMVEGLRYLGGQPERLTPARARVLDLAGEEEIPWTRSGLAHAAGVSMSVVDGLTAQGIFETVFLAPPPVVALPDPDYISPRIEGPQKQASVEIVDSIRAGGFSASLIDGVTGSGKTEVYFEAIAETLRRGKQVLILLPEIALTSSFLERFQERFGAKPGEWHSDLAPRMREKVWRGVVTGEVKVVAGARSALFLPFEDLGLIIVDEEHDPAYKQEDRVFYNARDMAVVRARIGDFPIVLVSATPSVESQVNGLAGRYNTVHLPTRFGDAALPDLHLIDMRRHPPERGGFLSPVLLRAMKKTLERNEQSLLFLNRRGYAPLTLCRVCGHRFQCPQCSSLAGRAPVQEPDPVPSMRLFGTHARSLPGMRHVRPSGCLRAGVERIAEEVEKHFPEARTIVMSSDLLGGVKRMRLELEAIAKGEADIVIGTQLVAKGHNFPLMTLVGIVDPISACPTAIPARPSAPSSFSPRSRAARGEPASRAMAFCRPSSRSIR